MGGRRDQDLAIIVGRQALGESDWLLRLVTARSGRVDVVARGARRSRRRFGGALDVGTRAVARWVQGRGALPTLEDLSEVRGPRRPREDWDRLTLLAYGCELIGALSGPAPEGRLHRLLDVWLELLEGQDKPGVASRVAFEAKALTFAGLLPTLDRCAVCGDPLGGAAAWDPEAGGALHARCGTGEAIAIEDLQAIEVLRRTPLADSVGGALALRASWRLSDFVRYQTGAALKSRAAFHMMEQR